MFDAKKQKIRKIADGQIRELFRQADANLKYADKYVRAAWKIATKTKTPIPRELKRRFCRKCLSFWIPGRTCRVRVSKGRIIYLCFSCKHIRRFVYK
jgi:ribonuclease P protein subunit RPR2